MKKIVDEFHPNNLVAIRKEHDLSQKDLGEILGVSYRQICNYETGERSLTIDKAMILSNKFNYSLDWIYNRSESCKEINTFKVDIRKFLSCDDDNVYLTIPENFWDYIHKISDIEGSINTKSAKSLAKLKAHSEFDKDSNNTTFFIITMPKEQFGKRYKNGNEWIPIASEHEADKSEHKPTEEQKQCLADFFGFFSKSE